MVTWLLFVVLTVLLFVPCENRVWQAQSCVHVHAFYIQYYLTDMTKLHFSASREYTATLIPYSKEASALASRMLNQGEFFIVNNYSQFSLVVPS